MKIKQIRNATLRIDFGGAKFLVDPYLAERGAYPGFAGTMNSHLANPLVGLRTPLTEILDVDAALAAAPAILGEVCGVVFRHPAEKTLYLAGDTVWNHHVQANLAAFAPDVVVLNAGDARIPGLGAIIMGAADVQAVHAAAPRATLIASHMEAVNHCVLTRQALRAFAAEHGLADRLRVPEDDEAYVL